MDKANYLIFKFMKSGLLPKVGIFTKSGHVRLTNLGRRADPTAFNRETKIVVERLLHLFEIIKRPYNPGKLYSFKTEFKSRTAVIDGETIFIWEGLVDSVIDRWTKRWIDSKTMSENDFFLKHFNKFYLNIFKPLMADLDRYINKDPNTQYPDFWEFYTEEYTIEYNSEMIKFSNLLYFLSHFHIIRIKY
jgi:hypothetical protein